MQFETLHGKTADELSDVIAATTTVTDLDQLSLYVDSCSHHTPRHDVITPRERVMLLGQIKARYEDVYD